MADITKILLRRDSEANWQSVNPVLGLGEPGVAIDKNGNIIGFKIGDGNTTWNDLTYQTGDFSAMAQRVEHLEDSTSDLTNQVTNLSSAVDNLDSLVTDPESGIKVLANKVSAQEVTITDNTRDISNLETNKENISNKVSQLSSESTNTQYPGAKTVYDAIEDVQDNIRAEANARNAQDTLLSGRIDSVESLIPDTATSDNKLTDEKFVNSSIATNTATFRGTFNIVTDLDLTTVASEQEIIEALNAKFESLQITPDNNDYCFIAYPNNENPDSFDKYDRYKYSENIWEYEFTLNNASFTTAQWAAINSGITKGNVEQIATNTANITNLQNSKQDKLTAGANITINENNVISATGGGGISSVKAENVDSESATQGQVLTANGNGGASWQNASGGASGGKYQHYILLDNTYRACCIIENNQIDTFTIDTLKSYLTSKGYFGEFYSYPVKSCIYTHSSRNGASAHNEYVLYISNVDGLYIDKNNNLTLACVENRISFDFTDGAVYAHDSWANVDVLSITDTVTEL